MATPVNPHCRLYSSLMYSCIPLLICILPVHANATTSGNSPKKPTIPERISIVVRDFDTDSLIPDAVITIFKEGEILHVAKTNDLGFAEIPIGKKAKKCWQESFVELSYQYPERGNRSGDTIRLNTFLTHYELYSAPTQKFRYDPSTLTADVHLQTSLRVFNHFARELSIDSLEAPGSLNWYNSYRRRSTLHKERWYEAELEPLLDVPHMQDRRKMMGQLLRGQPTSCKGSNNRLCDYTQATYPHLKRGKVALSFNPITPIEKSVANSWFKRLANSRITGLKMRWLGMIHRDLSHWDNFRNEYEFLMKLSRDFNHFPIRFYTSGMDLDTNLTTIVNCAEGGHLFHGPLMARKIDLITSSQSAASKRILRQYLNSHDSLVMPEFNQTFRYFTLLECDSFEYEVSNDPQIMKAVINRAPDEIVNPMADSFLAREVLEHVRLFKDTSLFQIWLINIAHHTYNHLYGHAVAFDQGGLFGGYLAKFMHSAHTSNEHYATWRRMFYNISGPNELGKKVMNELITRNEQGHRILIDLKHSGYATRKWFFDSVMVKNVHDSLPPVCSHCAANGQNEIEYSRYADEFRLRDAPLATTFYPFELNLYDEEITRIFQADGLIGIKLEQRGLGGYLNKHELWERGLKQSGKFKNRNRPSLATRFSYVRRWLRHYLNERDTVLNPSLDYIRNEMQVSQNTMDILEDDYVSAEPFLQNLFYFIDHSGYSDPDTAWGQLCIGSDLDGIINTIDICPTSGHYPEFKMRLKQFIPIFLKMRIDMHPEKTYASYSHYFDNEEELDHALDQLFFLSAKNFVEQYFIDVKPDQHEQTYHGGVRDADDPVRSSAIH